MRIVATGALTVITLLAVGVALVAGDKARTRNKGYARMIARAEHLYELYLKECAAEGSQ